MDEIKIIHIPCDSTGDKRQIEIERISMTGEQAAERARALIRTLLEIDQFLHPEESQQQGVAS